MTKHFFELVHSTKPFMKLIMFITFSFLISIVTQIATQLIENSSITVYIRVFVRIAIELFSIIIVILNIDWFQKSLICGFQPSKENRPKSILSVIIRLIKVVAPQVLLGSVILLCFILLILAMKLKISESIIAIIIIIGINIVFAYRLLFVINIILLTGDKTKVSSVIKKNSEIIRRNIKECTLIILIYLAIALLPIISNRDLGANLHYLIIKIVVQGITGSLLLFALIKVYVSDYNMNNS